jgi:hypothetical protein
VADIAEVWRRGSVVSSWLLDLTADALASDPKLDGFSGSVADSGEGRWTIEAAMEQAVPVPVLSTRCSRATAPPGHLWRQDPLGHALRLWRPRGDTKKPDPQKIQGRTRPPTTLFLFGAHGDLVKRLLMPALYNLSATACWTMDCGSSALTTTPSAMKTSRKNSKTSFARGGRKVGRAIRPWIRSCGPNSPRASATSRAISSTTAPYALAAKIAASGTGNAVFYLATAPRSSVKWRVASARRLAGGNPEAFRRVVIKAFGSDCHRRS